MCLAPKISAENVPAIHEYGGVHVEAGLPQALPQQDPVSHVVDLHLVRGAVLEPNGVADIVPAGPSSPASAGGRRGAPATLYRGKP